MSWSNQSPYNQAYGQPSNQYGQPNNQYVQPSNQYGQPNNQYGQPSNQYGQPNNQYVQPSNQYGQPNNQYGQPSNQYGQPNNQYGQPNNQYGQPNNQYGQPSNQYGQPSNQLGAPPTYNQQCPPGVDPNVFHWFQSVDQDRSGKITADELQKALMNNKMEQFNRETCRLMIGMFDKNRDGTIDLREFGSLWCYVQEWRRCFDSFDADRSGNIDANELHRAFATFGYRLSSDFCRLVVRSFDRGCVDSIDFDDFIQVCVTLRILTEKFREKDSDGRGTVQLSYEQFLEMTLDNSLNIV